MNGNNLNVRYRRNAYAKKRIKVIAFIVGGAVIVLAILFLVFGGILKDKVDDDRNEDATRTDQVSDTAPERQEVASVNGYGFSLVGATNSAISEKATEIQSKGGNSISFMTRDESGNELFSSSVARGMNKQGSSSGYVAIDSVATRAENKGLRACAIVPIDSFLEKDELYRSVLLSYDAAICAELVRDGADDVLVLLRGTQVDEEKTDELLRLARAVKENESEAVIGIALTREMLESEGSESIVARLWEEYDFLALDMTAIEADDDPLTFAQESVSSEIHYYLLRYNMRVLLPSLDEKAHGDMVSVLVGKGLDNWQTVVK